MTDDIAVEGANRTFPKMNVGTFFPADRNGSLALQLTSRDERNGLSDEDGCTARVAGRTTSDLCHDVAAFAAVITVIAILLPLMLRFARASF